MTGVRDLLPFGDGMAIAGLPDKGSPAPGATGARVADRSEDWTHRRQVT
jgi:hypothetical protein